MGNLEKKRAPRNNRTRLLRRSPLVGADLNLGRSPEARRKFDLRHVIPKA
jgi:hypothetical protein